VAVPALEPDVLGEDVVADVLVPDVLVPVVAVPDVVVPVAVVPDVVLDVVPDADVPAVVVPWVVEAVPAEPVDPDAPAVFVAALLPAPVEPAVVAVAFFWAVLVPCEELVADRELVLTRAIDATAAVVLAVRLESAGSLPDTSCRKITDQSARNRASAIATTRLRITDTRRSRARSRCATSCVASTGALCAAGGVPERLPGSEASEGVIGTSLRSLRVR
jgi:hypothetical protein